MKFMYIDGEKFIIEFHEKVRAGEAAKLIAKAVAAHEDFTAMGFNPCDHAELPSLSNLGSHDDHCVTATLFNDDVRGSMQAVCAFSSEISWNGTASINWSWTEPAYRNKGLSRELCEEAIRRLILKGATAINRSTSIANDIMVERLYRDDRFRPTSLNFLYVVSNETKELVIESQKRKDVDKTLTSGNTSSEDRRDALQELMHLARKREHRTRTTRRVTLSPKLMVVEPSPELSKLLEGIPNRVGEGMVRIADTVDHRLEPFAATRNNRHNEAVSASQQPRSSRAGKAK